MFLKKVFSFIISMLFSRSFTILRESVFGAAFGASKISDAFLLAFRLPTFLRTFISDWTMCGALVPEISYQLKNNQKKQSELLVSQFLTTILVVLVPILLILEILTPYLANVFCPGYAKDPNQLKLFKDFLRIMFPLSVTYSISSIFVSIQSAYGIFWVQPSLRFFLDFGVVVSIYLFQSYLSIENLGYCVSFSVLFCCFLQVLFTYLLCIFKGFNVYIKKNFWNLQTKELIIRMLKTGIASIGLYMNAFIDISFASFLSPGFITYLVFGDRLNLLFVDLLGGSVAAVMLNDFGKLKDNKKEMDALLTKTILIAFQVTILSTFILIMTSNLIIPFVFQYGKFIKNDCMHVAKTFCGYCSGLSAFCLIRILSSYVFTINKQYIAIQATIFIILFNFIFKFLLIKQYSYVGIAISTGMSLWVGVFVFAYYIRLPILHELKRIILWLIIHGLFSYLLIYDICIINISLGFFLDLAKIIFASVIIGASYFGIGKFLKLPVKNW